MQKKTYIDIHTHRCFEQADLLQVCNHIVGRDAEDFRSGKFYSVGIHPWFLEKSQESLLQKLERLAEREEVKAIGESGYDKLKGPDFEQQDALFRAHIRLSEKLEKPLFVHCVHRYNELRQLHKELAPSMPWIVHGFTGHPELAKQLTGAGLYLSFGYMATYTENKAWRSLKSIPADSFFLETDGADLRIEEMYRFAAEARGMSVEDLQQRLSENYQLVFGDE